jgi:hypothetical protein
MIEPQTPPLISLCRPTLWRCFRGVIATVVLLSLLCPQTLHAVVDDAHSAAMELASPQAEKGFRVREEYWKGESKNAETKQIRHQLFKGNEYWFWLGVDSALDVQFDIQIYDSTGKAVQAEVVKNKLACGARVLPGKTGSYVIIFTLRTTTPDAVPWAVAYGYR